jgi:phosphohistidine phosphatase
MELYLVRHGQAAARDGEASRSLTDHGAEVVRQVAAFAARAGVRVDEVRHSGKLRARQTAEILAEALAPPRGVNAATGLDPDDDVQNMAESLQQESGSLMLVGHLPFLSKLAGLLVTGDPENPIVVFHTASIARLARDNGSWTVDWAVTKDFARQAV